MSQGSIVINGGITIPLAELRFRSSRSGGPGGQNVNKLETRVELLFDLAGSPSLSEQQKRVLLDRLRPRIDRKGILRIVAQESRSQWENKQRTIQKFVTLVEKALRPRKKRLPTGPSKASQESRLYAKKRRSEIKRQRRRAYEE